VFIMRNAFLLILVVSVSLLLTGCIAQPQDVTRPQTAASAPAPADRAAIEQSLLRVTDGELAGQAAKLSLEQIAVDTGWALATWSRGDAAGQALLRREGGAWTVLAHERGWMGVRGLSREGVPDPVARRLLDQIDPNWATYARV
jgi:hypothetical protein